jgi:hypothetical protein
LSAGIALEVLMNAAIPLLLPLALATGVAVAGGSVNIHTNGGITHLQPPGNGFNTSVNASSSGSASVSRSVSGSAAGFPFGGGPVSTNGQASGTAADGLLRAYSSSNVYVSPFPVAGAYNGATSAAGVQASWIDTLTFNDPDVPNHAAITYHASLLVSGSLVSAPGTDAAFRIMGTGVGPGPNSFFTGTLPCSNGWCEASINGAAPAGQVDFSLIPLLIHTFAGAATGLQYLLTLDSNADVTVVNGFPAAAATAIADFGHTVEWGGISSVTLDATGASLSNYTLTSADGFDYSHAVTAVPEPRTYAMLLAGLGFLAFAARRRRAAGSDLS